MTWCGMRLRRAGSAARSAPGRRRTTSLLWISEGVCYGLDGSAGALSRTWSWPAALDAAGSFLRLSGGSWTPVGSARLPSRFVLCCMCGTLTDACFVCKEIRELCAAAVLVRGRWVAAGPPRSAGDSTLGHGGCARRRYVILPPAAVGLSRMVRCDRLHLAWSVGSEWHGVLRVHPAVWTVLLHAGHRLPAGKGQARLWQLISTPATDRAR